MPLTPKVANAGSRGEDPAETKRLRDPAETKVIILDGALAKNGSFASLGCG
jgi:hypothetical protein